MKMALDTPKSVIFVTPGTSVHPESNAFMYVLSISGTVILNYIVFGCSESGAFKPDSGLTSSIWNLTSYIEKFTSFRPCRKSVTSIRSTSNRIRHSKSIWTRHSISSNRNQHRNSITPAHIMLSNRNQPPISI